MQCKDVEAVVEQEGLSPLPKEVNSHLAECRECRNYIADLTSIVDVARKMPSEITPPDRIWISLRAQLEAEGIIREPVLVPAPEHASWWQGFNDLFRSRALATASVGMLILFAGFLQIRTDNGPGTNAPAPLRATVIATEPFAATRIVLNEQEPVARGIILASTSPVDNSLRDNLQKVDDFIADCEHRLNDAPQDDLAREYLSNAYQQKAELLSAMMDRGGSVN
jgi:hypothetical protein